MAALELVPADIGHIDAMRGRFRAADIVEVRAAADMTVEEALAAAIAEAHVAATVLLDGRPEAVFGVTVADLLSGVGSPWMLGTDELFRHPKLMLKMGRHYVSILRRRYYRLYNYVHAENHASIRWLSRIGFVVHPPVKYGVHGELFHPFEMRG